MSTTNPLDTAETRAWHANHAANTILYPYLARLSAHADQLDQLGYSFNGLNAGIRTAIDGDHPDMINAIAGTIHHAIEQAQSAARPDHDFVVELRSVWVAVITIADSL